MAIALGVPLFVLVLKIVTRQLRPLAEASLHEDAVKYGMAEQNLATLPIIKSFTREVMESQRYARQSDKVHLLEMRRLRIDGMLGPIVRLLMGADSGATTIKPAATGSVPKPAVSVS